MTEEQRASTLARYDRHRATWDRNQPLRTLYADWYARVASHLPNRALGPFIEIGSGPGFAKSFIPDLQLTDIVRAPWHQQEISAHDIPAADGSVGALVLFDVLHHLAAPAVFFSEAARVLADGGRIVLCEPYVSPLSFPAYRWFHAEALLFDVDPLASLAEQPAANESVATEPVAKDPFDGNQAIPTLIFGRKHGLAQFAARFPSLKVLSVDRLAGLAHPLSGGFSRAPLLPLGLWGIVNAAERHLPSWIYRLIGFRMLVVIEKRERSTR